jgi:hypothetical protein
MVSLDQTLRAIFKHNCLDPEIQKNDANLNRRLFECDCTIRSTELYQGHVAD